MPNVALLVTCLAENFLPRSAVAAVELLEHFGYRVSFPEAQTCCGQPMFNNGLRAEAADLARRTIATFEPFEAVVTPSPSCAVMVQRHYLSCFEAGSSDHQRAVKLSAKTHELCEFLVTRGHALAAQWRGRVALHSSCHTRELRKPDAAQRLLSSVSGLELAAVERVDQCCGFGGTFMVKFAEVSQAMVTDKIDALAAQPCDAIVSNDSGCTLNIEGAWQRRRNAPRFLSTGELLAEALGLIPREDLGREDRGTAAEPIASATTPSASPQTTDFASRDSSPSETPSAQQDKFRTHG